MRTPKKTVYISGPMSGLPCFNFPNFFYWQRRLEKTGWKVINTALIDCMKMLDGWRYTEDQWEEIVTEDCRLIREEADAIFVLDGHKDSVGAKREIAEAEKKGLDIYWEVEG